MQFSWFFFFAFFKKKFFYIFYFFADSARRLISFKLYNSWWVCANLHTGYAVSFLNRLFIYSFVVHTRFLELPFSRETTTTTTKKKADSRTKEMARYKSWKRSRGCAAVAELRYRKIWRMLRFGRSLTLWLSFSCFRRFVSCDFYGALYAVLHVNQPNA